MESIEKLDDMSARMDMIIDLFRLLMDYRIIGRGDIQTESIAEAIHALICGVRDDLNKYIEEEQQPPK